MTLATSNIYERVVKVEHGESLGTGTVIDHDGETYLLTAAHVLPADEQQSVSVSNRFRTYQALCHELPVSTQR